MASNPCVKICLKRKQMLFTRLMVTMLGNPSHLSFWYDEANGNLIVSAATGDDLDAYEIQACYWKSTKHSCEVARLSFIRALQHRIGWEDGSKYAVEGSFAHSGERPAIVFDLMSGVRVR
jgi:hypothetical protein